VAGLSYQVGTEVLTAERPGEQFSGGVETSRWMNLSGSDNRKGSAIDS